MSEAKIPKKFETVAKQPKSAAPVATKLASGPASSKADTAKTDTPKTEAVKTDQSNPDPTAPKETTSASESVSADKSASQASISHFSSVSTPEYRSGWNKIFGTHPSTAPAQPSEDATLALPSDFSLSNAQISRALRANLAEAFQHLADMQGINLSEMHASIEVKYTIECRFSSK